MPKGTMNVECTQCGRMQNVDGSTNGAGDTFTPEKGPIRCSQCGAEAPTAAVMEAAFAGKFTPSVAQ